MAPHGDQILELAPQGGELLTPAAAGLGVTLAGGDLLDVLFQRQAGQLLLLRHQRQVDAGAVDHRHRVERSQLRLDRAADRHQRRVVSLAQAGVSGLEQRLGAGHVTLQLQPLVGQAQQVLGFGVEPLARIGLLLLGQLRQHLVQGLVEALAVLVELAAHHLQRLLAVLVEIADARAQIVDGTAVGLDLIQLLLLLLQQLPAAITNESHGDRQHDDQDQRE